MANITLLAPAGVNLVQVGPGYPVASDGTVSVPTSLLIACLGAGCQYISTNADVFYANSPPVGTDLTSIVAAVLPVSGTAFTIAAQPRMALKLNVRCVQSGAVAGLVVTIVGVDGRGNTITENVNVAGASTATFVTANAFAKVTSATPVGTVTNVTTLGLGNSTAIALPLPPTFVDLVVFKEVKATAGTAATLTDEAVGTVDLNAGTVVPTTAADGTLCFYFYYAWTTAA